MTTISADLPLAVPIGLKANGQPLVVPLVENSTLVGGLPGTGKSGTLRSILVGASHRPNVAIVGMDAKRVELRPWAPRLSSLAVDLDSITETLERLVELMELRYEFLDRSGLSRWNVTTTDPQIVLVVDELAEVVASGEPGDAERGVSLRRLLSKGRAAGITPICATQRPSGDVIPTRIRDLFALRIAHATSNRESTGMILGAAWREGPAHEIPVGNGHQGRCFAVLEGERWPTAGRIWHVDDDLVRQTVGRTAHLRQDIALLNMGGCDAPQGGAVKAERSSPVGLGLDGSDAGATITDVGQDEASVLAALVAAGRPMRTVDLQQASGLPEGRCRRAAQALLQMSRVLFIGNGYWMAA